MKFVEMFDGMVRMDRRHPLCIIDMQMPDEDGKLDERRGLHTAGGCARSIRKFTS